MENATEIIITFLVAAFYILGVAWAPVYAFVRKKSWKIAVFLIGLNTFLGWSWFSSLNDPDGENGFVVVSLIFLFPPFITITNIVTLFVISIVNVAQERKRRENST